MELIVGDTETSGLGPDAGVVEVAWVEIDDDMRVLREVHSLIHPGGPISPAAMGIHRITDAMVADAPPLGQFVSHVAPHFATSKVLLIAHNAPFDARFFQPHVAELETLCTLRLARRVFPQAPDHKLATLMYYLGLPVRDSHAALGDVLTCLDLLRRCAQELGTDLEGVYHLMRRPQRVATMPFGKDHKGKRLEDVPSPYLRWCLSLADLDSDLRYSIEQVMAARRRGQ